jgi:hypothetical protein
MTNRKNLYGYHIENGTLAVVPREAEVVERVHTLYLSGASYQAIAEALNGDGVPYSAEAPDWNKHKVKRLLENPRYTGADGYPAILTESVFQTVQEQIRSKTAGYTFKEKRPALGLVQYLRCGCGDALQRVGGTVRRKDTLYLKCGVCNARVAIPDEDLLAQVSRQMAEHDYPDEQLYVPSAEVVRLTNAVNRGLEHPSAPEDVVALILQGVSARYDCCPAPIEQENLRRPAEADLKRFGQAASHITITGNLDVTVHFK